MQKVLVIVGPTAVGKTALSIELAKVLNGEVISGDSVQIYKKLNIGSAKITNEEMQGVKHHLIDLLEPNDQFSVADFQKIVREKISEITSRNNLPIICGGTGLYIQATLYDFNFVDSGRNEDFLKQYESYTNEELHNLLFSIDNIEATKIHKNNRRRVLRAIEMYYNSSKNKSELINEQKKESLYDVLLIGLEIERELLYDRINKRVDNMMNEGLLNEVYNLYKNDIKVNVIGYKEFYNYFEQKKNLDEVVEEIKKNTRHYAKRQLTYFKNKLNVNWINVDLNNFNNTLDESLKLIYNWLNN